MGTLLPNEDEEADCSSDGDSDGGELCTKAGAENENEEAQVLFDADAKENERVTDEEFEAYVGQFVRGFFLSIISGVCIGACCVFCGLRCQRRRQ